MAGNEATTPFEISDWLTERWADLEPVEATFTGIAGRDAQGTDYSPDGHEQRADLYRSVSARLTPHADHPDSDQAMAARVLTGWLNTRLEEHESRRWARDLNHIASPFQRMRDVFDVMPRDTRQDWENVTGRLLSYPGMLEGYRESLTVGLRSDDTAAARQVLSVIEQLEHESSDRSRFVRFVHEADGSGHPVGRLQTAAEEARRACASLADWLRSEYLPAARAEDGVGRDRYLEGVEHFLGMSLDPEETYEWGWSEVHRLRAEMETTASLVDPDMTVTEVIELLDTDPERGAPTRAEFVDFITALQSAAVDRLAGVHFDVPSELRTVTVNIAPPGGSLGAWYVGPSEDLSRPGSIWYAPGERELLPYWQEVSTAYHEGFPGHHLQVGTAVMMRDRLSRFHRTVIWYSGAGEGWALYAERLMDELGFFENPDYRLGLLASQLFRSVRVVVDIGCQLGLVIPDDAPLHPGRRWTYERAVDYMEKVGLQARDVSESEVKRYLGWWGQAISYKVGERVIMELRDRARRHAGESFDRKDFHRRMLEAGAIRLDQLRDVIT